MNTLNGFRQPVLQLPRPCRMGLYRSWVCRHRPPFFSVLPAMDIVPSNPHGVSSPSEKHRHLLREARLKSDKSNSAGLAFTLRSVCPEGFLCNVQKVPGFTWDHSHPQLQ